MQPTSEIRHLQVADCTAPAAPCISPLMPSLCGKAITAARPMPPPTLPEGVFQAQMHIHCQHAILPVRNDLPHYKDWPPAFGGSDETVDW